MLVFYENDFLIDDEFYGGNQQWLPKKQLSGAACGPTTAANIFSYLIQTRPELAEAYKAHIRKAELPDEELETMEGFMTLLNQILKYIRFNPLELVTAADSFEIGAKRFARSMDVSLRTKRLKIPIGKEKRPTAEKICSFIADAIDNSTPVAFLNLAPGAFANPKGKPVKDVAIEVKIKATLLKEKEEDVKFYPWYWATVIGIEEKNAEEKLCLKILDNNSIYWADLTLWLADKKNSGSFIRLIP